TRFSRDWCADVCSSDIDETLRLGLGGRAQIHAVSEALKSLLELARGALLVALEVVGSEIFVVGVVLQHVVDGSEQGSSDGDNRLLLASPSTQSQELRSQIAVFAAHRSPSCLNHHSFQPALLLGSRSFELFVALVCSRLQTRPGNRVAVRGKLAHINAELRDSRRSDLLCGPRSGHQVVRLATQGLQRALDAML